MNNDIVQLLGDNAAYLLDHTCRTVSKDLLHLPGPDFVDRVWALSDRNNRVLGNMQRLYSTGRLAGTGYVHPAGRPGLVQGQPGRHAEPLRVEHQLPGCPL